jgi:hypothetical protein
LDIYSLLFIIDDVKHSGNAKVNSPLYVSTLKTKEQRRINIKHVEIT